MFSSHAFIFSGIRLLKELYTLYKYSLQTFYYVCLIFNPSSRMIFYELKI